MRRSGRFALAVLLSGLFALTAVAADQEKAPMEPQNQKQMQKESGEPVLDGTVPPAQLELMRKREEARQRRDELMKLRQQKIEAAQEGEGEQAPQ